MLELLSLSLGWAADERFGEYLEWKHQRNPLGPSPAWLALDDGEVVGYRAFLRWEFEQDGRTVRGARAVDVATHPRARRRGVFRALTSHAIETLRAEGVEVVFTTPNDKAGPGWIDAGARELGRLPVAARIRSPRALVRMARSRGAADRWPLPCDVGEPASSSLQDPRVDELLHSLAPAERLRTRRTSAFLRWRYGLESLGYRTMTVGDDPTDGLVRVPAEASCRCHRGDVCDVLVPERQPLAVERARAPCRA